MTLIFEEKLSYYKGWKEEGSRRDVGKKKKREADTGAQKKVAISKNLKNGPRRMT